MNEMDKEKGILFVVGTPIGNLNDLSLRAIETFKKSHVIAAEDTRRTRKLLTHLGLSKQLISCHEHNMGQAIPQILEHIAKGASVVLVTDGGMPCISDPGYQLVSKCHDLNLPVQLVPGPSAVTGSIALSGLAIDRFCFEGFLPKKKSDRLKRWEQIKSETRAIIVFEAPHRFSRFLKESLEYIPNRNLCVCREMTKIHEQIIRGNPERIIGLIEDVFENIENIKGEITIVIAPESPQAHIVDNLSLDSALRNMWSDENSNRDIAQAVADAQGLPFRKVYKRLLELIQLENLKE